MLQGCMDDRNLLGFVVIVCPVSTLALGFFLLVWAVLIFAGSSLTQEIVRSAAAEK